MVREKREGAPSRKYMMCIIARYAARRSRSNARYLYMVCRAKFASKNATGFQDQYLARKQHQPNLLGGIGRWAYRRVGMPAWWSVQEIVSLPKSFFELILTIPSRRAYLPIYKMAYLTRQCIIGRMMLAAFGIDR